VTGALLPARPGSLGFYFYPDNIDMLILPG
jgi:hypothetical protein